MGRSLPSNRLIEPDQVFDVAFIEPVPYPVADSCMVFRSGLRTAKFILDRVKIPHQNRVPVVMGFHLSDQRSDGVDIAPPEVFPVPFCFYRRGATPTENVRDDSYVHALLFGVSQGLGGDECGKFRRIAVNPMDRVLSLVSEIPGRGRIVRTAHDSHRSLISWIDHVSRMSLLTRSIFCTIDKGEGGSGADRIVGAIRSGVRSGDADYAAMR